MTTELFSISEAAAAFQLPVSTLRYYDDVGLVRAPVRRSRVRYYDRESLTRLAYVLLWRFDGMLSVEDTTVIVGSRDREDRNRLIVQCRYQIAQRISRLNDALQTLEHMMQCPQDDPVTCEIGSIRLRRQVDEAISRLSGGTNGQTV